MNAKERVTRDAFPNDDGLTDEEVAMVQEAVDEIRERGKAAWPHLYLDAMPTIDEAT